MAIRVRRVSDGCLVALCAAKSESQSGDIYLDDEVHYALARKFWRDYDEVSIIDKDDIQRADIQEQDDG